MTADHIPNYGLYGEYRDTNADIGIHIEAIEERSRGQDWLIKPHRHGKLFQVLCIFDGEAAVQLDEESYSIRGWGIVTIPIGVVHGFSFKPDSQGFVVTLSEETVLAIHAIQDAEYLRPLFEVAGVINIKRNDRLHNDLENYIALMRSEFAAGSDARSTALLLLANLLIITIKRQLDYHSLERGPNPSQVRTLDAFRRLIEMHFREHWQVSEYAAALNVSTSTLNRMCHERFGNNAKTIITDRLLSEARRRLVYTRQSLDQIAYYLGYKDPAYFSRVFKKMEACSPGEFRRSAREN